MTTTNMEKWNQEAGQFPRPDLQSYQLRGCYSCKGTRMDLYVRTQASGAKDFRGICVGCGAKTGSIPYERTVDSIGCTVMPFGKRHKGKTLHQIAQEDESYFDWALANIEDEKLLGSIVLFLRLRKGLSR